MVCVKPFVSLVVWWEGDERRSCNKRFNSRGLLLCCTKLKTTWWRHHLILAWPISGKGRLIPSHTWKSNIQAVYPFSTHECKNGKSRRFLVFSLFWKKNEKWCLFLVSVFNIISKNEWTQRTRTFKTVYFYNYSSMQMLVYVRTVGQCRQCLAACRWGWHAKMLSM